ncbi:VOC family protein [Rhizobium sp. LjRoot98]|nr:VOC family protein [Rhizobium sp. Root1204]
MPSLSLHHVSIITADLQKSLPFYREVFGLSEIPRP